MTNLEKNLQTTDDLKEQSELVYYVARILEKISVQNEATLVCHRNYILISANNAEEAYSKSIKYGESLNEEYENSEGKKVTISFCGLGELMEVYEPLEDGSELFYEERRTRNPEEIEKQAKAKNQLAVFRPREPIADPDFMPNDVFKAMKKDGISVLK